MERLAQLLVSAFPGSTIYQHADLLHVPRDVLHHKVDAVFLDAEMNQASGQEFVKLLRRQKPDVRVFLISKNEEPCRAAMESGANGCFVLPDGEQRLLDAVRSVLSEENVS